MEHTTGDVARATGLSEKAVRLYAERGLLTPEREAGTGRRCFTDADVRRARSIALLRGLGISMAGVGEILDAGDPVASFDRAWSTRRHAVARSLAAAEHARSVLAGAVSPLRPALARELPERLVLRREVRAALPEIGPTIGAATQALFAHLEREAVPLAGHVYVEYEGRATEDHPALLQVCVPVAEPVRPELGETLGVDGAHHEAYVALSQAEADDQPLLVAVHDGLSAGAAAEGMTVAGPHREIYLPSFGRAPSGESVMEVAVVVAPVLQPTDRR